MPLIETLFEKVAMDIVRLLLKSSAGYQYILVVMDYAIQYPEAVPLQAAMGTHYGGVT